MNTRSLSRLARPNRVTGAVILGFAALLVPPIPAAAQIGDPVHYRLVHGSNLFIGCYDPCDCAAMIDHAPLNGRFTLQHTISEPPALEEFALSEFHALAVGLEHVFDGRGTYQIIGDFTLTERLVMSLQHNGAEPILFDSGTKLSEFRFPIIDISIAMNGFVCLDTALRIVASPRLGDWNADNATTTQDLFLFLEDWFSPGGADYDLNGINSTGDLFAFIRDWFMG